MTCFDEGNVSKTSDVTYDPGIQSHIHSSNFFPALITMKEYSMMELPASDIPE